MGQATVLISEDTKVTKSGFTFQELILSEAGIFIHVVAINCSWCYDVQGRVKEQQREFFLPMAVWNAGCQEGLGEVACLREHPGRWSGKETPPQRQGCVKRHVAAESLRGFGLTGEWMDLTGTSWGWTFIPSKSEIFPAAVWSHWRH